MTGSPVPPVSILLLLLILILILIPLPLLTPGIGIQIRSKSRSRSAKRRRIAAGDALRRSGGWGEYPGILVCGKTLGVVGFGASGRGVARRGAGFDMKILAYDPAWTVVSDLPPGIPPTDFTSLEDLLAHS